MIIYVEGSFGSVFKGKGVLLISGQIRAIIKNTAAAFDLSL